MHQPKSNPFALKQDFQKTHSLKAENTPILGQKKLPLKGGLLANMNKNVLKMHVKEQRENKINDQIQKSALYLNKDASNKTLQQKPLFSFMNK